MKRKKVIASLLLIAVLGACQKKIKCESYNSEIVTKTVDVDDFDKIELEIDANVIYTQDSVQSISIEAPEKLLPKIKTSVFQNNLKIGLNDKYCFLNQPSIKVYIKSPELKEVNIEGSGNFKVENGLETESLALTISGSGNFYTDSLNTESLTASISGSGDIYASGTDTIEEQRIKISGSGDVNFFNIPASETSVSISGSGNCSVYVLDRLDVKISGSGDVTYKGVPIVNSNISGSGSVKHH